MHFAPATLGSRLGRDMPISDHTIDPPRDPPYPGKNGGSSGGGGNSEPGDVFALGFSMAAMFLCYKTQFNVMGETLAVQVAANGITSLFVNQTALLRRITKIKHAPSFLKEWPQLSWTRKALIASSIALGASGPVDVEHTLTHKLDSVRNSSFTGVMTGCLVDFLDNDAGPPGISDPQPAPLPCPGF